MIEIVRAKMHCIRVTGSELGYHGSITLDPAQCAEAGILPLEFVRIWNKNNGARLSTYVIYGEPGSRCCILNGAAARACQPGDELIICASEFIASPRELPKSRCVVLCFDAENRISEKLLYKVNANDRGCFDFRIDKL